MGMPSTSGTSGPIITDTLPPPDSTGSPTDTEDGTGTTSGGTVIPDGTGTTGDLCETILCDGVCCEDTEECVNEQCLPACESEIRCGENQEICCDAGQVCLAAACATPTGPCIDSFDCQEGEFCEPTLEQCLPQPEPLDCEIIPDFGIVQPTLEWSFEEVEVVTMPAVGDIDGDMDPEVVVSTWNATDPNGAQQQFYGHIYVLDGLTGQEQFRIENDLATDQWGAYGRTTVGLSDVDGNDLPDIIYAGRPEVNIAPFPNNASRIHAVDGLGQHLWESHAPDGSTYYVYVRHGAPAFANFDDDDASEIVWGTTVIDNDGTVVFDQDNAWNVGGGVFGSNGDYLGGISTIADLTGDGYPEIISGREAWTVSWNQPPVGPPTVSLTLLWQYIGPDGFTAVADLDQDGDPEVVLVGDPAPYTDPDGAGPEQRDGQIQILDGATGQLWCGVDPTDVACQGNPSLRTQPIPVRGAPGIPGGGRGGPPTIADFDGDGRPEIAVAGANQYTVYDINRMGEEIVQPGGDAPPVPGALYVRWTSPTQDQSSNSTGSSVFDFQGDGTAEVLYGDECYTRVYDGVDGNVLIELENSSGTIHEYPLVVDVDDDGNSEVLVVANDAHSSCAAIPGYTNLRGVRSFGDTFDQWVQTRRVWTQHTYHVTNASAGGHVPPLEIDNWTQPDLNNYRQNVQGEGVFNAPDLTVELVVGLGSCLEQELELRATVRNVGSLGVPANIDVTLYEGTDSNGAPVGTMPTPVALLPGAQTVLSWTVPFPSGSPALSFYVEVDGTGPAPGVVTECDESNNSASTVTAECPAPG
ncbi:MAG: VCBS repeat-containing protein [Myxococcales bacterium]|nr:VCBS repeat-containing protein [Myxococcales bacterium]